MHGKFRPIAFQFASFFSPQPVNFGKMKNHVSTLNVIFSRMPQTSDLQNLTPINLVGKVCKSVKCWGKRQGNFLSLGTRFPSLSLLQCTRLSESSKAECVGCYQRIPLKLH
jgi:hypothetical protein